MSNIKREFHQEPIPYSGAGGIKIQHERKYNYYPR